MRAWVSIPLFSKSIYIGERASIFGSSQKVNVKKIFLLLRGGLVVSTFLHIIRFKTFSTYRQPSAARDMGS
jgi:hypothetical protein